MSSEGSASWASLLATFALNSGLALIVGAWASLGWARQLQSGWGFSVRARSSSCLSGGIALTAVASVADLWARSADAAGVAWPDASPAVRSMLGGSHYGRAWLGGIAALLALAAITRFGLAARKRPPAIVLFVGCLCIAAFVYARSVVSHASEGGDLTVAVLVDWLHLVLIALWVGVVFVASVVRFRSAQPLVEDRHDIADWIGALSRAATIALVGIVGTGLFNIWRGSGGALASLPGSTYGTVLLIKLIFVSVALGLGAHNRFRILPPLLVDLRRMRGPSPSPHLRPFVNVIRLEATVLAVALALAAVLSATEAIVGP
jgi:putative copper resistance protein D